MDAEGLDITPENAQKPVKETAKAQKAMERLAKASHGKGLVKASSGKARDKTMARPARVKASRGKEVVKITGQIQEKASKEARLEAKRQERDASIAVVRIGRQNAAK